jgi:short-subunit dehydrogenase
MSYKCAMITGASQGIGKAVAIKLAGLGYNLALIARTAEKLQQVKQEINQHYPKVEVSCYPVDVSESELVEQAVVDIIKCYKTIDLLFNNAGISMPGTSEISKEIFADMIKVNLLGAFYVLHAVIPHMKQQQSGYIINLASRSGKIARPQIGAYAASKFGLVGFNEALYKELLPFNIKVTAINPGFVNTEMTRKAQVADEDKIQTEDIADTVAYLLKLRAGTYIKEVNIDCKANVAS